MASVKGSKIARLYEKKKKEIERLRSQLDESEKEFHKIKKLYDRRLNWEKTGDVLQQEVDDYLSSKGKQREENNKSAAHKNVTEESGWRYEERDNDNKTI